MKRANLGMLLCAIALASTSSVVALADDDKQGPAGAGGAAPRMHHRGGSGRHDGLIREVMTPDQQKKFDAIMQEAGANRKALGEQLKTYSQKQQSGQKLDPADDKKIADLQDQIAQIRKSSREKALSMLSEDQKSKLKDLVAKERQARSGGGDENAGPGKAD